MLFPFLAFARRLVGQRGRRAGDVRAGAVAAARAGVDDRRQRGAVPAAVGLRAGAAAHGARLPAPADLRASAGCSRRWPPSRATTRGWRCRSRCSRRSCSSAARPARDPARPGGVLAVRGVAAARVAGVGRARGRRSAVLRALHHDGPRRAGGGRRRAVRPAARSRAPAGDLDAGVRRGDDAARGAGRGDRARARAAPAGERHRVAPVAGDADRRRGGARRRRRFTWRAGCCSRASSRWRASRSSPGALLLPLAATAVPPASRRAPVSRRRPPPPRSRSRSSSGWSRRSGATASGRAPNRWAR